MTQRSLKMVSRMWRGVGHALSVWASRRDLERLDDRMLQDLGISRAQAAFEASRTPWQLGGHRR